jgi:hypothetical protein
MNLETGVAGFQHQIVVLEIELIDALDVELEITSRAACSRASLSAK